MLAEQTQLVVLRYSLSSCCLVLLQAEFSFPWCCDIGLFSQDLQTEKKMGKTWKKSGILYGLESYLLASSSLLVETVSTSIANILRTKHGKWMKISPECLEYAPLQHIKHEIWSWTILLSLKKSQTMLINVRLYMMSQGLASSLL